MMQNRGFSMSETETDEFIRNEKKIKESERPKPEDFGISPRSYDEINKMIENHEPKNKLPTPQLPEHRSKKNIVDDFESEEENELEESLIPPVTPGGPFALDDSVRFCMFCQFQPFSS